VGTTTALHGIIAAVYLSLLGPEGLREVGEAIIQKSHYAAKRLGELDGVRILFPSFFKEFCLNLDGSARTVKEINHALLARRVFGGKDISSEYPELGQTMLTCVTEIHSRGDIDRLAAEMEEVLR